MDKEKRKKALLATVILIVGIGLMVGVFVVYREKTKPPAGWPTPGAIPSLSSSVEQLVAKYPKLQKFLDDPKYASVLKEFVGAYNQGGVDGAKQFAKDRGFMNDADDITLTLLTENAETKELEAELVAMKVEIVGRGEEGLDVRIPWKVVEDEVKSGKTPDQVLERLANIKNVRGVLPSNPVMKHQRTGSGTATTEGVRVTHADQWHKAGHKGRGIRVGILDPEVSKASVMMGKAFPASTEVYLGDCVNAAGKPVDDDGTHGVAAAEIVHAMAPEAQLFIACSLGNWDKSIEWLQSKNVKIISYSAGGMYGRRDGTDARQKVIDKLTAKGILWVNSNGNEGTVTHRGVLAAGAPRTTHRFPNGKEYLSIRTGGSGVLRVMFIWNQWDAPNISDYDLFLLDSSLNQVAAATDANGPLRRPAEAIQYRVQKNTNYYVAIRRKDTTASAPFLIHATGARSIELPSTEGSLTAPADARGALSVGAVNWRTDRVEDYSSRGPTEDGRLKPEISAPTDVSSFTTGSFNGTSAAAPHVSGAAAVVWARSPEWSRDQVVQFLLSRSKDLGAKGPDVEYGHGRLDLGDPSNLKSGPVAATPVAPPKPPSTSGRPPTAGGTGTGTAGGGGGGSGGDSSGDGVAVAMGVLIVLGGMGLLGLLVLVGGIVLLVKLFSGPSAPPAHAGARGYAPPHPPAAYGPPMAGHGAAPGYGPAPGYAPQQQAPYGGPPHGPPMSHGYGPPVQAPRAPQSHGSQGALPFRAVLKGTAGAVAGRVFPLGPGRNVLGSGPSSAITVADPMVEASHVAIDVGADGCTLTDLGSPLGTFVEGHRVSRHFLRPGESITVGGAMFRFEVG